MNNIKSITVSAICAIMMFSSALFNSLNGQSSPNTWCYDNWSKEKDEVFELAKKQDKFVFLFIGYSECKFCGGQVNPLFADPANGLAEKVADKFVPWAYRSIQNSANIANIPDEYIKKLSLLVREKNGGTSIFPWFVMIDPAQPDSIFKWIERAKLDVATNSLLNILQDFIAIDLLAESSLKWHEVMYDVFELAKKEKKHILKLVGKGSSLNSQKTIQQLNKDPLKQILEKNFILWFSDDDCGCSISSSPAEPTKTLPIMSIFNSYIPDKPLEELIGVQDDKKLEEILLKYTVSNEKFLIDEIYVRGNTLYISNQTQKEQITIFSLTGQRLASVSKNDLSISIDASSFPKGILIIQSSAGWSAKFLLP